MPKHPLVLLLTALLLCVVTCRDCPPVLAADPPALETERRFREVLELRVSVSNQRDTLRSVLQGLAATRSVSIVLDPRIDPTQKIPVSLNLKSLIDAVTAIGLQSGANTSVVGNTIVVGPDASLRKLRTLAVLRREELLKLTGLPRNRRVQLATSTQTVHWEDLDEPLAIVQKLSQQTGVIIRNPDAIPHDLWAGNTLPAATFCEALTILLAPFDLTFQWEPDAAAVQLVPVPAQVAIEKTYQPRTKALLAIRDRKQRAAAAVKDWQQRFPQLQKLTATATGEVRVQGTIEDHELLKEFLIPTQPAGEEKPVKPVTPIARREFTLKLENVPVSALMQNLEQSGIEFVYNPAQLQQADIDLNTTVNINATKLPADDFFKTVFNPLKLNFKIDNVTVTLTPQ